MSKGEAAVVNGVWPPGGRLVEQSAVSRQRKPSLHRGPGHAVSRENRMTLPGHLAGGRAERSGRGAERVAFVI